MLGPDGNVTDLSVFTHQGGEGVAVDADGRVYLAAGQILVYSPDGTLIETIHVPERPTQVVFGGQDGRTLFICARTSLYSVRVRTPGR
jgi:sugar lactone lactonase YvrE